MIYLISIILIDLTIWLVSGGKYKFPLILLILKGGTQLIILIMFLCLKIGLGMFALVLLIAISLKLCKNHPKYLDIFIKYDKIK